MVAYLTSISAGVVCRCPLRLGAPWPLAPVYSGIPIRVSRWPSYVGGLSVEAGCRTRDCNVSCLGPIEGLAMEMGVSNQTGILNKQGDEIDPEESRAEQGPSMRYGEQEMYFRELWKSCRKQSGHTGYEFCEAISTQSRSERV